jgi:hypothetical protein
MPLGLLEQAQLTWAHYLLDVWESSEWESQPAEDREYGQRHLVEHLDQAGMPGDVLYDFLSKAWRDAWLVIDSTYTDYLGDIRRIWQRADAEQELAIQVKCALCQASVVAFSTTIPEGLLPWALKAGQLDAQQALNVVQRIPDEDMRAEALMDLIPDLPQNGLPLALETVRSISRSYSPSRAQLLERLIPHLPDALLDEALDVARSTEDHSTRAQAMTALNQRQFDDQRDALVAETLEVVWAIRYQSYQARELVRIAPYTPAGLLSEAVNIARSIRGDESRVRALTGLIPYLAEDIRPAVLEDALNMARVMEPEEFHAVREPVLRARALAQLLPYLDGQAQDNIAQEVLDLFNSITDLDRGADILGTLGPYLSSESLARALEIASAFEEWARPKALEKLAPHLSADQLTVALTSATLINDKDDRQQALQSLVPFLSATQIDTIASDLGSPANHKYDFDQTVSLSSALEEARQIERASSRAKALSKLVPELDEELRSKVIAEALDASRIIEDDYEEEQLVDELSSARPIDEVVADAHAYYGLFINYIDNDNYRLETYKEDETYRSQPTNEGSLTETMSNKRLFERLEAAHATEDEWQKWEILTEIGPYLSEETEFEAMTVIRSIEDEYHRVKALAELAPFLSETRVSQALRQEKLIDNQSGTTHAYRVLLPFLPADIVAETWEDVKSIQREDTLRIVLVDLLPRLPTNKINEALEIGLSISDWDESAEAMIALAPYVPAEKLDTVLSEALDAIELAQNEDDYPEPFLRVLPYLSDHMLDRALEVAGTLFVEDEEWRRAWAFRGFAGHLADWSEQSPEDAYAGWRAALARAAENPRPKLLRDLVGLHYFALALAEDVESTVRNGICQAVEEVCSW